MAVVCLLNQVSPWYSRLSEGQKKNLRSSQGPCWKVYWLGCAEEMLSFGMREEELEVVDASEF